VEATDVQRYILRRILVCIPLLFSITIAIFILINLAPGDPVDAMIDPVERVQMSPEGILALKRHYGLDKPVPVRYLIWLRELGRGNLGYSFFTGRPVSELLSARVPQTLRLAAIALVLQFSIGALLGVVSALRPYSWLDYGLTVLAFLGISIPNFFLAMAAIFVFAVKLGWLPSYGTHTLGQPLSIWDQVRHFILPATILAAHGTGSVLRYMRASMLEVMHQDYLTTARSKGLTERVVVFRHALRNALLPIITLLGLNLPFLFGGSIIIETMFAWPGIGRLAIEAINGRDYNVLMATSLMMAVIVMLSNLLADISYAVADPRIRYE